MLRRFFYRLIFSLERFIVRGALHQLLFITALIILVSLVSGTIVFLTVAGFDDYFEAVWWGFLRLSDPGYLGDDEGVVGRIVSTVVTLLGYVLFMGALVAIMTQGLGRLMRRLEAGVTPITESGHILILGWTNRTETIVRELLVSRGRVQRFLRRRQTGRLKIVVLAEKVSAERAYELRAGLGKLWDPGTIVLRSGDPLRTEHLARVDFLNAAAIILPAGDSSHGGAEALDARIVKTILSIANASESGDARRLPILTTELFDARKIEIARSAYAQDIEIIPSSTVISRLIAQNIRHGGLSAVYSELLTHGTGHEIYVREFPELVGRRFTDLAARFSRAIPLGVLRPQGNTVVPLLNPAGNLSIGKADRLVFIAGGYDAITPSESTDGDEPSAATEASGLVSDPPIAKRVLIFGWSHKLPALLGEFQTYTGESFAVTVASLVPASEREVFIERFAGDLSRIKVEHVEADYTAPGDMKELRPESYDNIVFLASDRLASGEESDARTILGTLLLRTLVPQGSGKPEILIELMDPDNHALFANRAGEILISPLIISHMLAHVTLRRDLWVTFEELFTAEGAEIYFRPPALYDVKAGPVRFGEIQRRVAAKGDIALGVYHRSGEVEGQTEAQRRLRLNPERELEWLLSEGDELVVLTTYA